MRRQSDQHPFSVSTYGLRETFEEHAVFGFGRLALSIGGVLCRQKKAKDFCVGRVVIIAHC